MLGIIRRRKPIIFAHLYVPLMDFQSDTGMFYQSIDEELAARRVPDLAVERINLKESGFLSHNRSYLRLRKERMVFDICSAPFGTSWWFSVRAAMLPRLLMVWEVILTLLGLASFFFLYWQFFGLVLGSIVFASSAVFLLVVFLSARHWTYADEFLVVLPVVGALYEGFFRPETYHRQDQRLMFGEIVTTIVRAKIIEFCAAGGVEDPQFITVNSPEQILTERELAKYVEKESVKQKQKQK